MNTRILPRPTDAEAEATLTDTLDAEVVDE